MYVCYIPKCCTTIQEHASLVKCVQGETCIPDGKHASLVICVWGNTHPKGYVYRKQFTQGNTYPYDTGYYGSA